MSKRFEIIDPMNIEKWDEHLLRYPGATFFHTQCWAKLLSDSYGYRPKYLSIYDKDDLCFLLPLMEVNSILTGRRGVSLPFSDYCEPMVGSGDISFREIQDYFVEFGTRAGWKFIEIRGGGEFIHGPSFSSFYTHTLDISQSAEQIFSKFSSSTRRNVKKSARDGVEVEICNTPESIKEFYRLNCLTRKKHGLPPQPYDFFKKFFTHIISKNHGLVVLASYGGQPIAGRIYLHFGKKVIDKYAASDSTYQRLKPNNLIIWEAIKWYSGQGYKSLCLGRTEPGNTGLRQFKVGFGAEQKIIKYYRYNLKKNEYIESHESATGFYNKAFRMMPMFLSRKMGEVLYRHVG